MSAGAERISQALNPDGYVVSYWLISIPGAESQVYRLTEYEPVSFDIYGVPLGARWECSEAHFARYRSQHTLML